MTFGIGIKIGISLRSKYQIPTFWRLCRTRSICILETNFLN